MYNLYVTRVKKNVYDYSKNCALNKSQPEMCYAYDYAVRKQNKIHFENKNTLLR